MATRAEARYVLSADDRTRQGTESARRNIEGLSRTLSGFSVAATAAGAVAVTALFGIGRAALKVSADLDDIAKRGRDIGVGADEMRALDFAAEKAGVSHEKMTKAVERVQLAIARARRGQEEYARGFKQIGIDPNQLDKESPTVAFASVLGRLQTGRRAGVNVQDTQEALLGEGVGRLIDFGAQGLIQAFEEVQRLGGSIREEADSAETAQDQISSFGKALDNVAAEIAEPVYRGLGNAAEFATQQLGSLGRLLQRLDDIKAGRSNTLFGDDSATRGENPARFGS